MAMSGPAVIVSVLMLLPLGILSATIQSEKEGEKLVRKERSSKSKPQSKPQATDKLKAQYCDYDFYLGIESTSQCADGTVTNLIASSDMCREAGDEAGAKTDQADFLIADSTWQDSHPKGCFKNDCGEATNRVCYFFNEVGDFPGGLAHSDGGYAVQGIPVCWRPKYLLGGKDSNGGCPAEYKLIENEDACRNTGNCLGDARGDEFSVGSTNATKQRDYSRNCFIDKEGANYGGLREVYYNPEGKYIKAMGWGEKVKGTPICQVADVTKWDPTKENTLISGEVRHYANEHGAANDTAAGITADPDADGGGGL